MSTFKKNVDEKLAEKILINPFEGIDPNTPLHGMCLRADGNFLSLPDALLDPETDKVVRPIVEEDFARIQPIMEEGFNLADFFTLLWHMCKEKNPDIYQEMIKNRSEKETERSERLRKEFLEKYPVGSDLRNIADNFPNFIEVEYFIPFMYGVNNVYFMKGTTQIMFKKGDEGVVNIFLGRSEKNMGDNLLFAFCY